MTQKLADLLKSTGIKNPTVLEAMAEINRADFLPQDIQALSEANQPLAIGRGQTCSQPYIVARMTELLLNGKRSLNKVLEVGTGSGYQAAVLSKFVNQVETVERIKSLYESAKLCFKKLGIENVYCHYGDGYAGWPPEAPYDAIIVTAAAPELPKALVTQLSQKNGRLIIPVGESAQVQSLEIVDKHGSELTYTHDEAVIFVPMLTGIKE